MAVEFAYQTRQRHDCAVFWVSAFNTLRFESSYRAIAEALEIPESQNPEKDVLNLVKSNLDQYYSGKWLMVVDNVDSKNILWEKDPERSNKRLWDYLPQNRNGMILFTTRSRGIAVDVAPNAHYPLDKMEPHEAEEFLYGSLRHHPTLYSVDSVDEFLKLLTHLPLAIVQALAYIKRNSTPLNRYLALLQSTDRSLIELLKKDFQDANRANESHNAVVATWLISFQHIQQENHRAADYLSFLACIAPQNVP